MVRTFVRLVLLLMILYSFCSVVAMQFEQVKEQVNESVGLELVELPDELIGD